MKMIEIKCPSCGAIGKSVPADMGDVVSKCQCGKYVKYDYRHESFEIVDRPERKSSSGLTFC